MSAHYTRAELSEMGFRALGDDLRVSRKASIYGAGGISFGSHVRIDDFCIISAGEGGVVIGNFIHIGAYTSIIGGGEVTLGDFANISSRVSIFSSNDDYSGAVMTGPMIPAEFTNIAREPVRIGRHVIIGCGAVILPGVTIGEGAAVGALSFVRQSCDPFGIYCGAPAMRTGTRERKLLEVEAEFLAISPNRHV